MLFDDPLPCPDPTARAVRMTLDMRERISELSRRWRKYGRPAAYR